MWEHPSVSAASKDAVMECVSVLTQQNVPPTANAMNRPLIAFIAQNRAVPAKSEENAEPRMM